VRVKRLEEVLSGFGRYRPWGEKKETLPMETKMPTPIRIALPVSTSEQSPPSEDDAPRFVPLAVAIDLGMTPPIGAIRTTPVDVAPTETPEPTKTSGPARRHLRLLPSPGA
jgi:hypothetical protein